MVNMLANASFEWPFEGETGWEANPAEARDRVLDGTAVHGAWVCRLSNPDNRAAPNLQSQSDLYNAVTEGQTITASASFRWAGGSATWKPRLDIRWFDDLGAGLGGVNGTAITPTTEWQRVEETTVVPAGVTRARVRVVMQSSALGDLLDIDAVQLEIGATATDFDINPNEETLMPFTAETAGLAAAANGVAAAIAYCTLHNADPAGTGGSRLGKQPTSASATGAAVTLDTTESFTGTPNDPVTHVGLWDGDPDAGGTFLYSCDLDAGDDTSFNAEGKYDVTGFTITVQ